MAKFKLKSEYKPAGDPVEEQSSHGASQPYYSSYGQI